MSREDKVRGWSYATTNQEFLAAPRVERGLEGPSPEGCRESKEQQTP